MVATAGNFGKLYIDGQELGELKGPVVFNDYLILEPVQAIEKTWTSSTVTGTMEGTFTFISPDLIKVFFRNWSIHKQWKIFEWALSRKLNELWFLK